MFDYPNINKSVLDMGKQAADELHGIFSAIDDTAEANMFKVLEAFRNNRISEAHFTPSTGYGYNDIGRDALEQVYADIFHTEDALVRPQITCGTHAIYLSLQANLLPQDELLFISGMPYDSLYKSIGITDSAGSLAEYGVTYKTVDLKDGSEFDFDGIKNAISSKTKMIHIQRSKGYSTRRSLGISQIGDVISFIRNINENVIISVDNCYGEFVELLEPTDVGADMCVGSLIKNPGGGIAPMGGYIAGKRELIERCANKLTAPGLGREVGASLDVIKTFYQGLSIAPKVVAEALKTAVFAARLAEMNNYRTYPSSDEERHCIVQAVEFNSREKLTAFCGAIQHASFVDSFVTPEIADMPGYDHQVIMASGSFTSGSSIELSADGPDVEPYVVYMQGGMTHEQGRYAVLSAFDRMLDCSK